MKGQKFVAVVQKIVAGKSDERSQKLLSNGDRTDEQL